jgi:hypothetical protein
VRDDLHPDRRLLVIGAVVVLLCGALGVLLGSLGIGTSGVTASPAAAISTPSVSASPSPPTDPEQAALVAALPTSVYRDCAPRDVADGQTASVRCAAATDGVDELLVTQWRDREAMDEGSGYRRYPDGTCSQTTDVRSTWDGGGLACYTNDNDHAVVLWQYADRALQVVAVRNDGDSRALYDWWRSTARTPLRAP